MSFAPAFSDEILPPDHRDALRFACASLTEQCFADIAMASHDGWTIHDAFLASYLPPVGIGGFTPTLVRQFTVCVLTVTWRLAQPTWIPLACLAEELALYCLVWEAKARLNYPLNSFEPFMDAAFRNLDFAYLYDENLDPDWDVEPGEFARAGPFSLQDWTKPFDENLVRAHPYLRAPGKHGKSTSK